MGTENTLQGTRSLSSTRQTRVLSTLLIALAVAALLAFAGCSNQPPSGSATSQAASGASSAKDEGASPDESEKLDAIVAGVLENEGTSESKGLSSFPTRTDDEVAELGGDDLEIGFDDEAKGPSAQTVLRVGGIQMQIPTSWQYAQGKNGWELASKDGAVTGFMRAKSVKDPAYVDVEAMAISVPEALHNGGADVVEVVNYENRYSSISGKLCAARIACAFSLDGVTYFAYAEYVVSKSHSNSIWLSGEANGFKGHLAELEQITESVAYNPGDEL